MERQFFRYGLIALLILLSPYIFVEVLAFLTLNVEFYVVKSIKPTSLLTLATIMIMTNLISAIITAFVTALASGYLAMKQARAIAIIIVVFIEFAPIYTFFQSPDYRVLVTAVLLGQFLAVVFSVVLFAEIGSHLAAKKQDKVPV